MNEIGYAALRVDMYGHGKSDGDFYNQTLFKWMSNVMTVIDFARNELNFKEIYLCGHSQGGLTVMLTAALKHEQISGLIALSPAIMIPDLARRGELLRMHFDPDQIPEKLTDWKGNEVNGNYARIAQTIHVEEAIARFTGPVLLIHGDADEAAPCHYSEEAAKAYRNAKLVIIPNDDHGFDHHLDMVVDAVKEWLPSAAEH